MHMLDASTAAAASAESRHLDDRAPDSVKGSDAPDIPVGACRHSSGLNDEAREQAIQRAGDAMVKAHRLGQKHEAREFLRLQNLLIAGRSAEQVASMRGMGA